MDGSEKNGEEGVTVRTLTTGSVGGIHPPKLEKRHVTCHPLVGGNNRTCYL